jgi:hypothetical protein
MMLRGRGRRLGLATVAAAAVSLTAGQSARAVPEVMSQASADAQIVLSVGNLQQASNNISAFSQQALGNL